MLGRYGSRRNITSHAVVMHTPGAYNDWAHQIRMPAARTARPRPLSDGLFGPDHFAPGAGALQGCYGEDRSTTQGRPPALERALARSRNAGWRWSIHALLQMKHRLVAEAQAGTGACHFSISMLGAPSSGSKRSQPRRLQHWPLESCRPRRRMGTCAVHSFAFLQNSSPSCELDQHPAVLRPRFRSS